MRVWIAPQDSSSERIAPMRPSNVAGRDDVHPGLGLHPRLRAQHGHGLVVQDVARVVEQAVLAVRGVRVECHIGEQAELREAILQRAHRARHQAIGVARLAAVGRLQRRLDHREQRQHRQAERDALLGHGQYAVDRQALHAGHAGHVLRRAAAINHEQRQDQVRRMQPVLAHQLARERIAAQPARAAGGERRGRLHGGFSVAWKPAFGGQAGGCLPGQKACQRGKSFC